jgi:hypothetical protein
MPRPLRVLAETLACAVLLCVGAAPALAGQPTTTAVPSTTTVAPTTVAPTTTTVAPTTTTAAPTTSTVPFELPPFPSCREAMALPPSGGGASFRLLDPPRAGEIRVELVYEADANTVEVRNCFEVRSAGDRRVTTYDLPFQGTHSFTKRFSAPTGVMPAAGETYCNLVLLREFFANGLDNPSADIFVTERACRVMPATASPGATALPFTGGSTGPLLAVGTLLLGLGTALLLAARHRSSR